jgi:hypothetical protein
VKILAQTNDVIGTKPIPEARNEIVKLWLRQPRCSAATSLDGSRAAKARIFPELISPPFGNPLL